MKFEVESAANFLSNMLKLHSNVLGPDQLERFKEAIETHLMDHYVNHWHPETPTKGSGYRCIRINHKMDPLLSRAGKTCGLDNNKLSNLFPNELTLWIDPQEVSYRIGENGSICVLFDGSSSKNQSGDSSDSSSNASGARGSSHNGTSPHVGHHMGGDHHHGKQSHPPVAHTLSHGNQTIMSNGGHHHHHQGSSSGSHHHKQHQMHLGSNGHQHGLQHNAHHHQQHSVNGHNNHHHSRSGNRSPTDSTLSSSTSTMSSPSPSSSPDWCKSQYDRRSSPDSWMQHHPSQSHPQQHQQMQQSRMPQGVMQSGDRHSSPVSVMNGMGHHQSAPSSSFGMDPLGIFGYPHPSTGGYAFNPGVMNTHQQNQRHTPQRPPPQFAGYGPSGNGWTAGSPY